MPEAGGLASTVIDVEGGTCEMILEGETQAERDDGTGKLMAVIKNG